VEEVIRVLPWKKGSYTTVQARSVAKQWSMFLCVCTGTRSGKVCGQAVVHVFVCVHGRACVRMCVRVCAPVCACVCACVYACVCVSMHVCARVSGLALQKRSLCKP